MAKMSKVTDSTPIPKEQSPPRFEDFLKPNPFIRTWMLKFLPENRRLQDVVIVGVGCVLSVSLAIALYKFGVREIIAAGASIVGVGILTGESEARYIIAGAKFGQANKQAQLLRTNKR